MKGKTKKLPVHLLRIGSLTLGAVLVLLGIYRGEHLEVLGKAVRICLECIGLG